MARERAEIEPDDWITGRLVGSVLELYLEPKTRLVTATAGRTDWGGTTPMDAGEALFGPRDTERE